MELEIDNFKRYQLIPIDKLSEADWNYKETDTEEAAVLIPKLKANIGKNGQVENIIVREKGKGFEVVNGNHRLVAMREIGRKKVICYNCGKLSKNQAVKLAIETNESKFKADTIKLAKLIKELSQEFPLAELYETMPYSEQEIDNMIKLTDFDWNQFNRPEDTGEQTGTTKEGFTKLFFELPDQVAAQLNGQIDRFKKALHPGEKIENVSYVQPIEAMVQHLAQIPDNQILGE